MLPYIHSRCFAEYGKTLVFGVALSTCRRNFAGILVACLLALPGLILAAGEGEGSYILDHASLVNGTSNNTLTLSFTTGATAFPATGGWLNIYFPDGFTQPLAANFTLNPAQAALYQVGPASYVQTTYTVNLANVPTATTLDFYYGFVAGGFYLNTTSSALSFLVCSSPDSPTPLSAVPLVLGQPVLAITSATPTPTITVTPTFSTTTSPTISPTFSVSPTITQTFTNTPVGPYKADGAYTYPNPFDLRVFNKVTLRFPADTGIKVDIYNLVGEPVARLGSDNINAVEGWAIWDGSDDYRRKVAGGIYFYRIAGDNRKWTGRFTVLH
jgi:hypothetical protein